jgi:predicted AAA+ superfamily ATPase
LIGIIGARGVGKTTMILQYMKESHGLSKEALYVSADDVYFINHSIISLAEDFIKRGGKFLYLDEVHKYEGWAREIKNIYDYYAELTVVFTGSSAIEIEKGAVDLSRRVLLYSLNGLSLREYISLTTNQALPVVTIDSILQNHIEISFEMLSKIRPLQYFDGYLKQGFYPFFYEDSENYFMRLRQVVGKVLETDLPAIEKMDFSTTTTIRKILGIISESVPFKPNILKLSQKVGVSKESFVKYLRLLEKASVIALLYNSVKGVSQLNKPEKVYLNNTNLMFALIEGLPNKGNLRETFFMNQVRIAGNLEYTNDGDFLFAGKYTFEVGGKTKGGNQIKNLQDAFIVADDIETGVGNKVPLWLFGFLY